MSIAENLGQTDLTLVTVEDLKTISIRPKFPISITVPSNRDEMTQQTTQTEPAYIRFDCKLRQYLGP